MSSSAALRLSKPAAADSERPLPARRRSARTGPRRRTPSDRLLEVLAGAKRIALVTHDNPDPDAISSSIGLRKLIAHRLHVPVDVVCRLPPKAGENRALSQACGFETVAVTAPDWTAYDRVVLVDTQPATGYNCVPADVAVTAAIDHHGTGGRLKGVKFADIRRTFGATATIVTGYLMEQQVSIDPVLGAALLFGIEVDTGGIAGTQSKDDDLALSRLHLIADKELLVRLRHTRLPQSYFEAYVHGLQGAFIYDDCILSYLGELESPEMTAIVADFLLRFEGVRRVVCAGTYRDGLSMSMRTMDADEDAGKRMKHLVRGYGTGGGHRAKAGGRIAFRESDRSADDARGVYGIIRRRLLRMWRIRSSRGRRLVARRDILEGLDWRG